MKKNSVKRSIYLLSGMLVVSVIAISSLVYAQTDASVTPLAPRYGGTSYSQDLWTVTYDKAIIPVSFTRYNCTSAALVAEYATTEYYNNNNATYNNFIPASASDLSQKIYITLPNLSPSTNYNVRIGVKCTSSSPLGSLVYTLNNNFTTPAVPPPPTITYSGRATFQYGDAGGSIENNTLLTQKVINLQNTGSNADTFRTVLPINPETRCGLRGENDSYPTNTLPNPLPATLDTPLAVNETKYISAVCITKGLPVGPFTWSYKTVSVGAADVNPVIAEVQDTVEIKEPVLCSDSDGGTNTGVKGTATGTYAGARADYIAIYGQEPNPTSPKPTTDKYSTYIDHCANGTQLNEGYCDASGKLQAAGIPCANGCNDGACVTSTPPASTSPSVSPIGHWKFDGNGNNETAGSPAAQIVGNASFKSSGGKFGGYAYIPGSSDWLKIPYNKIFDLPDSFTVEFWFRQRSNQGFNQDLIYKGSPQNNYNFKIFRYLWNQYNNGPVIAGSTAVGTGYWHQVSNPNEPPHNAWHHVAYTKTTGGGAYYIDGVLIHSRNYATDSSSEYSGPVKTPAVDIIIGDSAVDTDIDDLRIYNRALSHGEVLQDGGFPPPPLPGAGAPEPSNDEPGVWAQVDINSGQVLSSAICTRAVCGANGEYHGYVPPSSWATGSIWWPTSKRYIWQLAGQAGYGSGSFNFNTYLFTVNGGTIYNGVFTPTPVATPGTTTPSGTTTPPVPPVIVAPPNTPPTSVPPVVAPPTNVPPVTAPPGNVHPAAGEVVLPPVLTPVSPPVPVVVPQVTPAQCRSYLSKTRIGMKVDKQYLNDVTLEVAQARDSYLDIPVMERLLATAKGLIIDIEKIIAKKQCTQEAVPTIENKLAMLRQSVIPEIASMRLDVQSYVGYKQCRAGLTDKAKSLQAILKKKINEETRGAVSALSAHIISKLQELNDKADEFDYDAFGECEDFAEALDQESAPFLAGDDGELSGIIEDVVGQKLRNAYSRPSRGEAKQLMRPEGASSIEKSVNDKFDQIAVQIAELYKTVEGLSKSANAIAESVSVSYTALAELGDKFAQAKTQIEDVKSRLIPLVEDTMGVIADANCIRRGSDKENLIQQLAAVASENWLPEQAQRVIQEVQMMRLACRAKTIKTSDITNFVKTVAEAKSFNLAAAYKEGYTPFKDVPLNTEYFGAMITADKCGFMTQENARPDAFASRQDAMIVFGRVDALTAADMKNDCENVTAKALADTGNSAVCKQQVQDLVNVKNVTSWCAVKSAIDDGAKVSGSLTSTITKGETVGFVKDIADISAAEAQKLVGEVVEEQSSKTPLTRADLAQIADGIKDLKAQEVIK